MVELAHALGVSVEWLTKGDGPRERLSDVFVVGASAGQAAPYRPPAPSDLYPSRGEAIALLARVVEPDLRRIKNDPDLNGQRDAPPKSAYMPTAKKKIDGR